MTRLQKMKARMITHARRYPRLTLRDLFKYLHQSALGCEHLIASPEAVLGYIRKEASCLPSGCACTITEPLSGNYSRLHLQCLQRGLAPETLAKLFFLSAVHEEEGVAHLEELLALAREAIAEGALPFSLAEFDAAAEEWCAAGYPAMRHSEVFREEYFPAYRVIANRFIPFLPLLEEIDRRLASGDAPLTLAIEGGSASGKSTLAELLQALYGCTVFHMDDFFLRPAQRTEARLAEAGGNVDRERFLAEVLEPLSHGETVCYRPFDCMTGELAPPVSVTPTRLRVIEGVYSMHPDLAAHYDLSVFLAITPALQRERIKRRNSPRMAERFFAEWIPLETRYFEVCGIADRCTHSIPIDEKYF